MRQAELGRRVAAVVRGRRQQLLAAFLMGFIFAVFAGAKPVRAEGPQPEVAPRLTGLAGYDISWPQCGMAYPAKPAGFGVVGVNGGRPLTRNNCFVEQYRWAAQAEPAPAVYINLESPRGTSWHTIIGGAGVCAPADAACQAYNYGYNSARDAVAFAASKGVNPSRWWLDVETDNRWSEDTGLNRRVVQGAIDYLASKGFTVGAYSTPFQWELITGEGYRPGIASWAAGARNLREAQSRCTDAYAFAGGPVQLVQWVEKYDRNWACPDAAKQ